MSRHEFAFWCGVGLVACVVDLVTALHRPPWTAAALSWRKHRDMWDAYCRWDLEAR